VSVQGFHPWLGRGHCQVAGIQIDNFSRGHACFSGCCNNLPSVGKVDEHTLTRPFFFNPVATADQVHMQKGRASLQRV